MKKTDRLPPTQYNDPTRAKGKGQVHKVITAGVRGGGAETKRKKA